MKQTILVVCEHSANVVKPVTWQALQCASELADATDATVQAVVISPDPDGIATEIARKSGASVVSYAVKHTEHLNSAWVRHLLTDLVKTVQVSYLCIPHIP